MDFWFYFFSALGIGALHALEPGHGKSIMGAYLIMSRGRPRDAILLGLTSAVTHTLVIVVMAVLAHSAAAVALAGAPLPRERLELWLKLAAGIIIVPVGLRLLLRRNSACSCGCGTAGPARRFSGNLPDVLLLGFTNGLLPCPSALAVLLLSVSSGALASGLLLVLAFGVGGAVALIAVGLAFVKLSALAGNLFERGPWRLLPRLSGLLIALIGALTAYRALSQIVT
ncbi:sulfite exporter TauE/SafE family protein [Desulforamulus hydrothermalis]|uniref:High-affinity nickel-transporter n=1 Tax=Desulforamulus hydrothermalis Lam5 = DSM 18033 TaxID=1121428 RepID=K8EA13_9FIRM|nr:sulfite exporter TauE/SafE family protein [Desulforamulus hydrothermalis]CCO08418.1 High-affinity nickel-transporter [Desulforamulus hydrothermalis Lam5 = DSM 18033]SHH15003.1 ABC-type nickel/cobalt efflux system, permease component RcnA [Desulforamulus hydrothermalis Lam5 = DSM 18033]